MTIQSAVEFYERYVGIMTDDQIHGETGVPISRIKNNMYRTKGQLCWTCANACDDAKCEWVRQCQGTADEMPDCYPEYVKTETVIRRTIQGVRKATYVVACNKYKHDGRSK